MISRCQINPLPRWIMTGLFLACSFATRAADFPPADHAGSDLVLADGDVIWGTHTGISTFRLTTGTVARVAPFDGTDAATGMVEIHADHMDLQGGLDATGSGYTGGAGGGGGGSCLQPCFGVFVPGGSAGGIAGQPDYPASGCQGGDGLPSIVSRAGISTYMCSPGAAGSGGHGDGPFGGQMAGGAAFHPGGYAAPETNGDTTTDRSTRMGSGGGGQAGANGVCDMSGYPAGGCGGGRGGGIIRLFPVREFVLRSGACLSANGTLGELGYFGPGGYAGTGGSCSQKHLGGRGDMFSNGNGGAGGGILLDLTRTTVNLVEPAASLLTTGGDSPATGGTLKVFHASPAFPTDNLNIQAGRVFLSGPTAATGWEIYE